MLSLVELGRLEEAVEHTNSLLREGIGDYYENLQVHISLLVQLGKYQEVVDMLDAVLSENQFPSQYAESFYQLLHFSRQMVGDKEWLHQSEVRDEPIPQELLEMLESESLELQSKAIQHLREIDHPEAIQKLVEFLHKKDRDYVLQSIALKALEEKNCQDVIHMKKQGREMALIPSEFNSDNQQLFYQQILEYVSDQLEHKDPLLYEITKQLSWTHLWSLYPFLPHPEDAKLWGHVFCYCAAERIGLEEELVELEERYQFKSTFFMEKVEEVKELESMVYQIDTSGLT
ncbi:TPR repeat protein [Halalkalibacter wakoensis JCM 9140]|uniref:TPR repeat protein n=1 Tax=Halalkalibacter wakoensis JCM 9140 TaxID=1236970 RepID=W4Q2G8_9BACI|nr:HEAT repeat domain-containing protein [Halalkalibacter wakoensis]GAE26187.1 TPR repeat protein [Halalkalibacter wakoensis JCM 9140]